MSDFNVVLAERDGLGRIHLCNCNSIHLKIGPVTVCLAPEAFAQAAVMVRDAMEQLARIVADGRFDNTADGTRPSANQVIQ